MDINERLNALIIKYGIDRYHPRFRRKLEAERLIREFAEAHSEKNWIVIARHKIDLQAFCAEVDISRISQVMEYSDLTDEAVNALKEAQTEKLILIVSFKDRYKVKNRLRDSGINVFCLYDYFAVKGMSAEGEFYDIFLEGYQVEDNIACPITDLDIRYQDINYIFFNDRRCYESADIREYKQLYLAKMIFDSIYARDIEGTCRYIREYAENQYDDYSRYLNFSEELDALISEIRETISRRKQKDVVVFWLDALEYGEDQTMPWLASMAERGLEFNRAYTVTPYTHSTARVLFDQKYTVDDHEFNKKIDNSCELMKKLRNRGYKVIFYTQLEEVTYQMKGRFTQNRYTPLSQICWELLRDLIETEKPVFAVLHELFQTHIPCVSMGITGSVYVHPILNKKYDTQRFAVQKEESKHYTDQILKYYADLLNERIFKIYMSDHGCTYLDIFHTIFRVVQNDIRPQRISGLFSYISFGRLIEKLLEGDTDYRDIASEYARIQDTDFYNGNVVRLILDNYPERMMFYFGYEGIITNRICYLRYNDGREEYFNLKAGEPVKEEWVEEAAKLCPHYPDDILTYDKFKYSRNLYATLERYLKRNKTFEENKINAIIDIFEQLPEGTGVALRGGGEHSYRLWLALPWRLRKKISCVIDRDPQCMAARVGLPVIGLDQLRETDVKYIVVSSFLYETEWAEELQRMGGNFEIIRLYEALKDRSVTCKEAFYLREFSKEDIVWKE